MPGERRPDHGQEPVMAPVRVSVGDVLRGERERRSLSLDDVAANLRIRRALIDAIEDGRFKELPGAPYAVGFVKAYAEFLELDREEVIRRFKEEAAGLDSHKELHFPRPLTESRLPGGVLLLFSAVIAASAYAFWYSQSASERAALPRVAAVPERLAPLADPPAPSQPEVQAAERPAAAIATAPPEMSQTPEPAPAEVSVPTAPAAAPEPPAPAQQAAPPAAPVSTPPAVVPAPSVASAPASTPVTAPPPQATPSDAAAIPAAPMDVPAQPRAYGEGAGSRIMIRATADSWIQVRDPSGAVVFTRVLRAGDSYNVPNSQGLFLYTGSAGALEITVDGKTAPSIGQSGAVRRDVMLDPDRLAAGTAVLDQRRPGAGDGTRPSQTSPAGGRDISRQ